jgi:hypothetical protein
MTTFEHPFFHYHAAAYAFSGELLRPVRRLIEVQAGISLPFTGGQGRSNVDNFSLDHVLTFRRGYSHLSGSKGPKGNHTSHTTAVIEGLNVLDVLTADRVVARLTSDHDPVKREGHIVAVGSRFENLRISGCEVKVELDHGLLIQHTTHGDLAKNVATLKQSGRMAIDSNGVVICSLAKKVEVNCPGVEVEGHVVTVRHFGKIFLGEVFSLEGTKSVAMMRLELGSPQDAQLVAAGGTVDGHPWP